MLDNHVYNLMRQIVEENTSLWRIKNEYLKDAGDCEHCKEFWGEMRKDKEEHIEDLAKLIKEHM